MCTEVAVNRLSHQNKTANIPQVFNSKTFCFYWHLTKGATKGIRKLKGGYKLQVFYFKKKFILSFIRLEYVHKPVMRLIY